MIEADPKIRSIASDIYVRGSLPVVLLKASTENHGQAGRRHQPGL
jgi:hypothetical protein